MTITFFKYLISYNIIIKRARASLTLCIPAHVCTSAVAETPYV